ncbi:RNA polymerase subunit sigma [Brevibacillus fluminis]|uniref:RNA polymerase subunit sigma n=1 Tax=Brevibacillus fluminis TaxID=511487 RepID=UPI003F8ABD31
MKRKIALLSAAISLALTGCYGNESASTAPMASPASKPAPSDGVTLSAKEQEAYASFQKNLDDTQLIGLEPLSIAKLYVQARLDQKHDVVYALYTGKNGYVQWTKEEDEKIPDSDRGSTEQIRKNFHNIESGKFIQTSDFEGYIEYQPGEDAATKSGFKMIKDDDGIWKVAFQPLQ